MKYCFIVLIFFLAGCNAASSTPAAQISPPSLDSSHDLGINSASYFKDEAALGDSIATNLVMSDSLMKSGFTVYREQITNISDQAMTMHLSYASSGYQLFTRMHEQVAMAAMGMCGLTRDYWKVSHLDLAISELMVVRADGSSEKDVFTDLQTQFSLAARESVQVNWIVRAPVTTQICPFYSAININGFGGSDEHHLNLVGSSLTGQLTRLIEGDFVNSQGTVSKVPMVTNQPSAVAPVSDDGIPKGDDRDFGCNGFMQSMN